MESTLLQLIYAFYTGTVVVNVGVASMQYGREPDLVKRRALIYWLAILFTCLSQLWLKQSGFLLATLSSAGTLVCQLVLGRVISELFAVRVKAVPSVAFYLLCLATGGLLAHLGASFSWYGFVICFGAVAPVFTHAAAVFLARRHTPGRPLTMLQKMFLGVAFLMSLHYLDWSFLIVRPELFVGASCLAFALIHTLSILMPMVVVEHGLQLKNLALEDEVRRRVDELRGAQEELWEKSKLASIGVMAGGMAHELNAPLANITLQLDLMRLRLAQGSLAPTELHGYAAGIEQMVQRIAATTAALRTVASDRTLAERREADVRAALNEAVAQRRARMAAAAIDFHCDIAPGNWSMFCDPTEIGRAVGHLLDNAIDAVSAHKRRQIVLKGRDQGASLEVTVEDSGVIEQAIVPRMMDPFYTTKAAGEGQGLGLSITKAIAEAYGGSLHLDLRARTTRFIFVIRRDDYVHGFGKSASTPAHC